MSQDVPIILYTYYNLVFFKGLRIMCHKEAVWMVFSL